jgi:hypothetical protein
MRPEGRLLEVETGSVYSDAGVRHRMNITRSAQAEENSAT